MGKEIKDGEDLLDKIREAIYEIEYKGWDIKRIELSEKAMKNIKPKFLTLFPLAKINGIEVECSLDKSDWFELVVEQYKTEWDFGSNVFVRKYSYRDTQKMKEERKLREM